jgi:hypothetical protein
VAFASSAVKAIGLPNALRATRLDYKRALSSLVLASWAAKDSELSGAFKAIFYCAPERRVFVCRSSACRSEFFDSHVALLEAMAFLRFSTV